MANLDPVAADRDYRDREEVVACEKAGITVSALVSKKYCGAELRPHLLRFTRIRPSSA
jgi:hypothetical protein